METRNSSRGVWILLLVVTWFALECCLPCRAAGGGQSIPGDDGGGGVGNRPGHEGEGESMRTLNTISRKSHVWGPGVDVAARNTPVRYFYVHGVDELTERNLTSSPGKDSFDVTLLDDHGAPARAQVEVFDRKDGSFAVRYYLHASYRKLYVHVRSQSGEHLGKSPYLLENASAEACSCPAELAAFKAAFQCPRDGFDQIRRDLERFGDVNLTATISETISRFSDKQGACFAHYSIVDGKLYAKVHGPHTGFRMFSDAFLSSLVRKVKLPDVEFIVNLGDYPQERRLTATNKLPVFSWCGATDHADIVMPTYDVTDATVKSMTRLHRDMISSQQRADGRRWTDKLQVAFWRGRDSREERLKLARMSKANSKLLDAQLTNYFFFVDKEKELGRAEYVPFEDFFKYKYQVNLDGTVAAYRFPWLLAGGSVVLKQESPYYEHFYSQLKPWVHYVPVKHDLSDLLDRIKWLKANDDKAREMANNAVEFTRQHLMPESIFCYYALLFEQYASKLATPAVVREGMEEVEVEQPRHGTCNCQQSGSTGQQRDEL